MKKNIFKIILFLFIISSVTICYSEERVTHAKKEFVVIANKSLKFDTITYPELRELYLGRNRKINGEYIFPAMYMDCECFKLFLSKVMNMKKRDFDITWKKSIFTGRGKPPKIFRSLPEIVNYVKMNRNALAIVNPESITEDVKVLRIIEHVSSSNENKDEKSNIPKKEG